MTTLSIINLGLILSGELAQPIAAGDCVLVEDGRISAVGDALRLVAPTPILWSTRLAAR